MDTYLLWHHSAIQINRLSTHDEGAPSRSWEFIDTAGKALEGVLLKLFDLKVTHIMFPYKLLAGTDIQPSLNTMSLEV